MRKHIYLFSLALIAYLFAAPQALEAKARKRAFIEQYTSTKCGTCVDGFVMINAIHLSHPDEVVSAKLHLSDPMEISDAEKIYKRLNPNARPTATIDRNTYNPNDSSLNVVYCSGWYMAVEQALKIPAIADISAKFSITDSRTCLLTIKVSFDSIPARNMALNYYIIENDVTGGEAYDQANSYDKLSEHEYYNKGNPIKGFVHQKVIRYIGGDIRGVPGSLPPSTEITAGKVYTFTREVPLDLAWDPNNLCVAAIVQYDDSADIRVDNAVYAEKELSVNDNSLNTTSLRIYPNPATNSATAQINLPEVSLGRLILYNALGERITYLVGKIGGGETFAPLDLSGLEPGAYFLVLESDAGVAKANLNIIK
ncbi:MAG: Omp28-related outer membrane protein [Chloroflexota bacterium]